MWLNLHDQTEEMVLPVERELPWPNILEKTETMQCLIAINIRCTVPRTAEKDKKLTFGLIIKYVY